MFFVVIQSVLLGGSAQTVYINVLDTVNTTIPVITCLVCVTKAVVLIGRDGFVTSRNVFFFLHKKDTLI